MNFFLNTEQSCVPLPSAENGGTLYMLSLDERRQIEAKARLSQLSSPASIFVFLDVHEAPSTPVDLTSIPRWKSGSTCLPAAIARAATLFCRWAC